MKSECPVCGSELAKEMGDELEKYYNCGLWQTLETTHQQQGIVSEWVIKIPCSNAYPIAIARGEALREIREINEKGMWTKTAKKTLEIIDNAMPEQESE